MPELLHGFGVAALQAQVHFVVVGFIDGVYNFFLWTQTTPYLPLLVYASAILVGETAALPHSQHQGRRILVIEQDGIVERGKHDELIEKKGKVL